MFEKWLEKRKAEEERRKEEWKKIKDDLADSLDREGGPEALLTLVGTFFPDASKRFADAARDAQRLSTDIEQLERNRLSARAKGLPVNAVAEADLDAHLEIEKWRRKKTSDIQRRCSAGEISKVQAVEEVRMIDEVADAKLR
jgi:hypothetical protein